MARIYICIYMSKSIHVGVHNHTSYTEREHSLYLENILFLLILVFDSTAVASAGTAKSYMLQSTAGKSNTLKPSL